jgi:hypothetical protein
MDQIRFATPEEVETIRATSDLQPGCIVLAFENGKTGKADLAVLRTCVEVDPVYFTEETSTRRITMFMWMVAQHLRLTGVPGFYFQTAVDNEEWQKVAKSFGAIQVSPVPEYRFKVELTNGNQTTDNPDKHV